MPRKSIVWNYATKCSRSEARCNICEKKLHCLGNTTSGLAYHIQRIHGINMPEHSVASRNKTSKASVSSDSKLSMKEEITRMASVDGLSFNTIAKSTFIRTSFEKRKSEYDSHPPNCAASVRNLVVSFYEEKKKELMYTFKEKIHDGQRFSLTLDEYTSSQNKKFLAINIHDENQLWSLGVLSLQGTSNISKCRELVTMKLEEFGIDLNAHVVACTTSGESFIAKFGRNIFAQHHQCIARGIHLSVLSVLYKKNVATNDDTDEVFDEEGTSECDMKRSQCEMFKKPLELQNEYFGLITKLRKFCKSFKKFPSNNEILQGFVKLEHGAEIHLIRDIQTRWDSLLDMCERFHKLKPCVKKALDICSLDGINGEEWKIIKDLCGTLRPIEVVLRSLYAEDASLLKADKSMTLLFEKLEKSDAALSRRMLLSLRKNYNSRKAEEIISLFHYLHDSSGLNEPTPSGSSSSGSQASSFLFLEKCASSIYSRLYPPHVHSEESYSNDDKTDECNVDRIDVDDDVGEEEEYDFKTQLNLEISKLDSTASENPNELHYFDAKSEFAVYAIRKGKSEKLHRLYNALRTIKPTTREMNRSFSATTTFLTEFPSTYHSPCVIDALYFLKSYFFNKGKEV